MNHATVGRRDHAVGRRRAGLAVLAVSAWLLAAGTPLASPSAAAAGDPVCPADFNDDLTVDVQDLVRLLCEWDGPAEPEDLDGDGLVDQTDLFMLLGLWGPCP